MKTEPTRSDKPRTDADFMRELLTDWRIPFDDHEVGRRIAVAQLIHDKERENQRLQSHLNAAAGAVKEAHERIRNAEEAAGAAQSERDQCKARLEKLADVIWSIRWEPTTEEFHPLGALAAEIRSGNHTTIDALVNGDESAFTKLNTP